MNPKIFGNTIIIKFGSQHTGVRMYVCVFMKVIWYNVSEGLGADNWIDIPAV